MSFNETELKKLTVLTVDDMFNMRNMLKNMCRQMGFKRILEAKDGVQAVEVLKAAQVDLILCDWNMPRMKGVEVLRFVRSTPQLQEMPFIMVTAEMSAEIVSEVAEVRVDSYLVKPFTLGVLRERILDVLASRDEMSEIDEQLKEGRAMAGMGNLDAALDRFKKALAINPKSPRTLFEIGDVHHKKGAQQKALHYYDQSVEIQPKFLKGHEALAEVYEELEMPEKVAEHLDKAVKISPGNVERRFALGQAHLKAGNPAAAKEVFNKIVKESGEKHAQIVSKVGDFLLEMGEYSAAEKAFNQALGANPRDLYAFNRMGIAYRKQGKFGEAVGNYLKALKISPKDENLLYNLARAYLEGGDKTKAARALQTALRINPEFKEATVLMNRMKA